MCGDMPSRVATWLLVMPAAISRATSCSEGVRLSQPVPAASLRPSDRTVEEPDHGADGGPLIPTNKVWSSPGSSA